MVDQVLNYWKLQINWNKLEWVNPRSRIEGKNPFCVLSKKLCLKDNNKTAHRVGPLKLKPLYIYIFLRKLIINELEASLTGTTIEQSDYGMKNNPDLLQKAEVENADVGLTADVSEINEDYYNMNISMEEE